MRTPNDIEILIHCNCSPRQHPRIDAPAVIETIRKFIADGIIVRSLRHEGYDTTPKGHAWLECILNVDYPTLVWADKDGNIIAP